MAFGRKAILHTCRRFLVEDRGVTTVEWLAVAGAAIIIGVTMTYLATSGMQGAAQGIEDNHVNAAASQ